jgi:hypothetical protein
MPKSRRLELVDTLRTHLPHRCQATTRAGRQCKNRAQPQAQFCWVHTDEIVGSETLDATTLNTSLNRYLLNMMVDAGLITLEQLALVRVGIGVVVGLVIWLLYALLMWVGTAWFHLPLASWYTAGFALLLTCWLLGRIVVRSGILTGLYILFITLSTLFLDFFNKDGLILNICFVLMPFGLPAFLLYRYELSMWWGCLLVPLGFVLGKLFYNRLEGTSA